MSLYNNMKNNKPLMFNDDILQSFYTILQHSGTS